MHSALPFRIRSVTARCYRFPLSVPVVTSFGRMLDRPAIFARLDDEDGVSGWGEIWCNFPSVGAEHRTRIANEILAPLLVGRTITDPALAFDELTRQTEVLALQCGEPGPFAQAIAGIDLALWDLVARRADEPLWRLLGGASGEIGVYASGINPSGARATAERAVTAGHTALKLKIGFDPASDLDNLEALRVAIGGGMLAADVNQGWSLDQALSEVPRLLPFDLAWLEAPLRADQPRDEWQRLAQAAPMPLAAGENVAGRQAFAELVAEGAVAVVQPDAAKWGGLSGCMAVARDALAAGRRFCPHYLGGGIGLLASAHLLAAVGGDGRLEVDINPNQLRDRLCGPVAAVRDGMVTLGDEPGLGIVPDLDAIEALRSR